MDLVPTVRAKPGLDFDLMWNFAFIHNLSQASRGLEIRCIYMQLDCNQRVAILWLLKLSCTQIDLFILFALRSWLQYNLINRAEMLINVSNYSWHVFRFVCFLSWLWFRTRTLRCSQFNLIQSGLKKTPKRALWPFFYGARFIWLLCESASEFIEIRRINTNEVHLNFAADTNLTLNQRKSHNWRLCPSYQQF